MCCLGRCACNQSIEKRKEYGVGTLHFARAARGCPLTLLRRRGLKFARVQEYGEKALLLRDGFSMISLLNTFEKRAAQPSTFRIAWSGYKNTFTTVARPMNGAHARTDQLPFPYV
jgi:hypothetical protein